MDFTQLVRTWGLALLTFVAGFICGAAVAAKALSADWGFIS